MYDRGAARKELERLKYDVDFVAYAESQGYARVRAESCQTSVVLHHRGDDHKIVVKRSPEGRWYYWCRKDPSDKGTLIDFVGRRLGFVVGCGVDIRAVMAYLRNNMGIGFVAGDTSPAAAAQNSSSVRASTFNRSEVVTAFEDFAQPSFSSYLVGVRCISESTLRSPRFRKTWRVDRYGNAIFPHRDGEGICGYEKRGRKRNGDPGTREIRLFAKNGRKALWRSNRFPDDRGAFFCEGPIDGMSHGQLVDRSDLMYVGLGGEPSPWQWEYVKQFLSTLRPDVEVIAGFDADESGDRFARQLEDCAGRAVMRARPTLPEGVSWQPSEDKRDRKLDWNRLLQLSAPHCIAGGAAGRGR